MHLSGIQLLDCGRMIEFGAIVTTSFCAFENWIVCKEQAHIYLHLQIFIYTSV